VGNALGEKLRGSSYRVYVITGDGEHQEGSVWEAAIAAGHFKLDNLCAIVDVNCLQLDRATTWNKFSAALRKRARHEGPTVLLARTIKGKGVSFMENEASWHGTPPNKEQFENALPELLARQLSLWRMTTVIIDPELKKKCPSTVLGLVTARVGSQDAPAALQEEMKACEAKILGLPEPRTVLESSKIRATRAGYKALGKDPARYRGSAEALLRRILSRKNFPQINAVVDIINLMSVESRLPIGLYDLARVKGDITFRAGRAGETYKGIGKYDLNLEGLPIFCDELGPHGSPTSDSERTMVTVATQYVGAILISFGGPEGLEQSCQRMAAALQQYADSTDIKISLVS
jgi:DNA/RNA-binding domain of Phe-tRNA-synthetase-like protein